MPQYILREFKVRFSQRCCKIDTILLVLRAFAPMHCSFAEISILSVPMASMLARLPTTSGKLGT